MNQSFEAIFMSTSFLPYTTSMRLWARPANLIYHSF